MPFSTSRHPPSWQQKLITWGCVALQLLPPLSGLIMVSPAAASEQHMLPVASTDSAQKNPFEQQLASGAMTLGTTISDEGRTSSEALSDYARAQAGGAVNSTVEGWLSQFGTVRSQISLDKDFSLNDSSLDMLLPLYDSPDNMLFSQIGSRLKDDRTTVNLGMGMRFFPSDVLMYGVNAFFDKDITGNNTRMGLGGELWADYLKVSVNGYQRLSDWHQSRDFDDYDERPANGFDVQVNGFMPTWPQLGGKLVFEQYLGDEVALFSKEDRQKDPYAVTVGLNYTPIPMLTVGTEQKMGKSGQDDFNINMAFTYQLDQTWAENTSPDAVDAMRKLARSRYDLVERNNNIILEYRKQQVIKLHLAPEHLLGESKSTQIVTAQVSSKHGLKDINWTGGSFQQSGGTINALDATHFTLTLPDWKVAQVAKTAKTKATVTPSTYTSRLLNTYVLTAVAQGNKGNLSAPAHLTVEVLPPQAHFGREATVTGDNAAPDGVTPINVVYHIADGNKKALSGERVTLVVTMADGSKTTQTVVSDAQGNVPIDVVSLLSGKVTVEAQLNNGDSSRVTLHFADAQPDAAHSLLTASPQSIAANGKAISTLTLVLHDRLDHPISGRSDIILKVAGVKGTSLSAVKETSAGNYTATLSGTLTGTASITAEVGESKLSGVSSDVLLTSDESSGQIKDGNFVVIKDDVSANGKDPASVQATVTDADGHPLANQQVSFTTTGGALMAESGVTNEKGQVTVPVTNTHAGTVTVTITVNGNSQSVQLNFIADESTAHGTLSVTGDNAIANGTAANRVELVIKDAKDNPIAGTSVMFSADQGAKVATTNGITDKEGKFATTLTNTIAGISTVTATSASGGTLSTRATFVADNSSAQIAAGDLTLVTNNAVANGMAGNRVQVKVTDAQSNLLAGQSVSFTASNGATIVAAATTDSNGQVIADLTSQKAGDSLVTATINGSSQTINTVFIADQSTAKGTLAVTADNAIANGTTANNVELTMQDASGNPISGASITFSASNGATVTTTSGVTDQNGKLGTMLSSTTAGNSTVTAESANGQILNATVTFVADTSTAQVAAGGLKVVNNNAIANSFASNQVQVTVIDARGNPLVAQTVAFSASNGATIADSVTTDSSGQATVGLTNKKAGDSLVTATINGSSQTVNTTFMADTSTLKGSLSVTADDAIANGKASNRVQALLTDANGNPLGNVEVSFTADNDASITSSVTTNASGIAEATLTNTRSGATRVSGAAQGSIRTVVTTFIADASTAQIASGAMTVMADHAATDGVTPDRVRVVVTDANGNTLSGQSVSFTASNEALIAANGMSDDNGVITLPITSTTAGSSLVTATINGSSQTATVNFDADGNTAKIANGALVMVDNDAAANGTATNSVRATVTDAASNPISGKMVSFSVTNGATIVASGVTDARGQVTVTLTSIKAGTSTITATVNGGSQVVDAHFVADGSTAQITASNIYVLNDGAVANNISANRVQVQVTDADGNALADQTVSFIAGNGAKIAANGQTSADGTLSLPLTSTVAGESLITASINGSSQSIAVHFVYNKSTARVLELTTLSDNAVSDGSAANTVKMVVKDAYGNLATEMDAALSASNGATVAAAGVTDENGEYIASLTSKVAGGSVFTAQVNGQSESTIVTFGPDFSTAQIAAGSMIVTKDNALADKTENNSVTLKVTDANGNPLVNQTVNFTADNSASIAATGVTDADGILSLTVTSTVAGQSVITASINGNSQSVPVTFVADASTATIVDGALKVVTDNAITDGTDSNSVNVIVTDANGNVLPDMKVNFTADNDSVIAASGVTDANGSLTMTLTNTHGGGGVSHVTATLADGTSTRTVPVSFVGKMELSSITLAGQPYITSGQASDAIKVIVTDGNNGNPVQGVDITLSTTGIFTATGNNQVVVTTDTQGTAGVAGVKSSALGVVTVSAATGGQLKSLNVNVVSLTVTNRTGAVGAIGDYYIWGSVRDKNGNAVPGVTVYASISSNATYAFKSIITDSGSNVGVGIYRKTSGPITINLSLKSDISMPVSMTIK